MSLPPGKFVFLRPLPIRVAWAGKHFRFQLEQDPVSREQRLFARDIELERAGQYSTYLLATAGGRPDMDAKMFTTGISSEARPSFGMFRQLARDGRARAVN